MMKREISAIYWDVSLDDVRARSFSYASTAADLSILITVAMKLESLPLTFYILLLVYFLLYVF